MVKVLFVCMGNICRSPTAHGVFRHLMREEGMQDRVIIDSAGTHAYHVGSSPDRRAMQTAQSRGIDLADLVARQVVEDDFAEFDYILAMDKDNLVALRRQCPEGYVDRVQLFMDYAPEMSVAEVPDPYYGGPSGFERVFDLVDAASRGLLAEIRRRHSL